MIKYSNNDELCSKRIADKYFLFYQVWKELADRRTMDSYQYRIMNSLSALDELSTVIGLRLNRAFLTSHNVDECKAESAQIIKADPIISKYYPSVWNSLMKHLNCKCESDSQLRALRYQIGYSYNLIRPDYLMHLVEELEQNITGKNDEMVVVEANMLMSCCASKGWSTAALYGLIDILHGSADDETAWTKFKDKVSNLTCDNFFVYIPISLQYKSKGIPRGIMAEKCIAELIDLGISIKTMETVITEIPEFSEQQLAKKDYMSLSIDAFDPYSACYKAIDRCSDVLSMLSFYNYIEPWNCDNVTCWVVSRTSRGVSVLSSKQLYASYDYMDSTQRIFRASKHVFLLGNSSISKKLQATYAYANMGKASGSQEEKFMNMWVALESLCRCDVYDNIISNVLETVPPALCARYIYRHYRNFIEDCRRCDIELTFSIGEFSFDDPRDMSKQVRDIISVLKDEVLSVELAEKCKVNDLLSFRCAKMKTLSTDTRVLLGKITRHNSNVRYQLGRLYRIRNSIAHTGMTSSDSIILYIEHLEDYLYGLVSEIVMCADEKKEDNIETVFEIIKDNYDEFVDLAMSKKQADAKNVLQELLASGVIALI